MTFLEDSSNIHKSHLRSCLHLTLSNLYFIDVTLNMLFKFKSFEDRAKKALVEISWTITPISNFQLTLHPFSSSADHCFFFFPSLFRTSTVIVPHRKRETFYLKRRGCSIIMSPIGRTFADHELWLAAGSKTVHSLYHEGPFLTSVVQCKLEIRPFAL